MLNIFLPSILKCCLNGLAAIGQMLLTLNDSLYSPYCDVESIQVEIADCPLDMPDDLCLHSNRLSVFPRGPAPEVVFQERGQIIVSHYPLSSIIFCANCQSRRLVLTVWSMPLIFPTVCRAPRASRRLDPPTTACSFTPSRVSS